MSFMAFFTVPAHAFTFSLMLTSTVTKISIFMVVAIYASVFTVSCHAKSITRMHIPMHIIVVHISMNFLHVHVHMTFMALFTVPARVTTFFLYLSRTHTKISMIRIIARITHIFITTIHANSITRMHIIVVHIIVVHIIVMHIIMHVHFHVHMSFMAFFTVPAH